MNTASGISLDCAIEATVEAYLDSKPASRGKRRLSRYERDSGFSTFLRKSQRDAWLHKSTTLRKTGGQLRRKVAAVQLALAEGLDLTRILGLEDGTSPLSFHGRVVDTSIE